MPKDFCLVPANWDEQQCVTRRCDDGSHKHVSRRKAWDMQETGEAELVHEPVNRRDRGVLRQKLVRLAAVRGLSCRVGETLASAIRRQLEWAQVMLAEIQLEQSDRSSKSLV